MSLIGKKPISIPDKVKIKVESGKVFVEGPKGKLDWVLPSYVEVKIDNSIILVKRLKEDKKASARFCPARRPRNRRNRARSATATVGTPRPWRRPRGS